jgi:hypothetical protein
VESLAAAMEECEANSARFEPKALRDHALGFDRQVFKRQMAAFLNERWAEHVAAQDKALSRQPSAVSGQPNTEKRIC